MQHSTKEAGYMQCYEYLAVQRFARRHLGQWTDKYDDLDLAEVLDDQGVTSVEDVRRRVAADQSPGASH